MHFSTKAQNPEIVAATSERVMHVFTDYYQTFFGLTYLLNQLTPCDLAEAPEKSLESIAAGIFLKDPTIPSFSEYLAEHNNPDIVDYFSQPRSDRERRAYDVLSESSLVAKIEINKAFAHQDAPLMANVISAVAPIVPYPDKLQIYNGAKLIAAQQGLSFNDFRKLI